MLSDIQLFSSVSIIAFCILAFMKFGSIRGLYHRPALVLLVSLGAGLLYRKMAWPVMDQIAISDFAKVGLAALAFAAAMQFRMSTLARRTPAALRLSFVGAPIFLIATAFSAFVLLQDVSPIAAILISSALMINGSAVDRRVITSAPVPALIKSCVRVESGVALAIGLPIAVMIENAVTAPMTHAASFFESGAYQTAAGFVIGGSVGLAIGRLTNRLQRTRNITVIAILSSAIGAAVLCYIAAPLLGGSGMIAAGAVGLFFSEESRVSTQSRRVLQRSIEEFVMPVSYAAFGFILGPLIFQANLSLLIYAIAAVTLLRVVPRLLALKSLDLPAEQHIFLSWFGGAPGAASALFLLYLSNSTALFDQTSVLAVGATCVVVGVLGTRLSAQPLASYFIRQTALSRKRRYFS